MFSVILRPLVLILTKLLNYGLAIEPLEIGSFLKMQKMHLITCKQLIIRFYKLSDNVMLVVFMIKNRTKIITDYS